MLIIPAATITTESRIQVRAQSQNGAKGWRGLVPLRATRRDVEGLLGAPETPGGSSYLTDDERVYVTYSDGPCEKGWPYGWNVPPDTVERIYVKPKKTVYLSELNFDEKKYVKDEFGHIQGRVAYTDVNAGFSIDVDEINIAEIKGKVEGFSYIPTSSDLKLACPDSLNRLPVGRRQADSLFRIDAYGDLAPKAEHERLDSVAAYMKQQPDMEAYIIAYAGTVAQTGEAEARATCARNYLITKHRINADRIKAIDGGYQELLTVEVYVEPKDGDVPLARPTVRPSKVKITQPKQPLRCPSLQSRD